MPQEFDWNGEGYYIPELSVEEHRTQRNRILRKRRRNRNWIRKSRQAKKLEAV